MNMLVKNQLKDVVDELRDVDYNKEITEESDISFSFTFFLDII